MAEWAIIGHTVYKKNPHYSYYIWLVQENIIQDTIKTVSLIQTVIISSCFFK